MKNPEKSFSLKDYRTLVFTALLNTGCPLEHPGPGNPRVDSSQDNFNTSDAQEQNDSNTIDTFTMETTMAMIDAGMEVFRTDSQSTSEIGADAGMEIVDAANDLTTTDLVSTDSTDAVISDTNTADTLDVQDSGSPTVRCGRGLIPAYPLAYNIPTGTSVPAEIATADSMPGGSNVAEISWGDAPVFERISFDVGSPSRALGNHIFTTAGGREAVWRLNGMECGRQSFTVIDGATTRVSCSSFVFDGSDNIRVGESATLRINAVPRSTSVGDSPLTYFVENLPTSSGMVSFVGPGMTARIIATNPPGAGSYVLRGRACSPRSECATCPSPTLTVRP